MNRYFALVLISACASAPAPAPAPSAPPQAPALAAPAETAPAVRLPSDTRPTAEAIELSIDPAQPRFSGAVDLSIVLDHPRSVIWLHGRGLHVTRVEASPGGNTVITGSWHEQDARGLASITLARPLPAGPAQLHVEFDAAFGTNDAGLAKLVQGGAPYVFTQFEPIDARAAFPCFDEPGFKIPFEVTLVVPDGQQAIANTRELGRRAEGTQQRIHYAPTLPLPSYLLAFAVGPLDVVPVADIPPNAIRKTPLPLRGVATHGNGGHMTFALAHAGELIALLEQYTGIAYPYDKLDLIAVPDKRGAMENAGAVMFEDHLLFVDGPVSLRQRRGYASVVAHELAHQWTGDLVTMAWWDDLWLNEAFATWIAAKVSERWDPSLHLELSELDEVQHAMGADALITARQIRQPIDSTDDIADAFDAITYTKGGAVLAMFEHWVGEDAYQRGLHDYLTKHRFGNATADDFLDAESAAAGKDIKAAFHSFLDQPGVPFVEADVRCSGGPPRLHLKQSRYLPIGSKGDAARTWQLPVCARFGLGKAQHDACTLLTEAEGDLALGNACPDWVQPNANAHGYFRFSLAPADLAKLAQRGLPQLSPRDRIAYANSLRAAYNRGTTSFAELLPAARALIDDPMPLLASQAMSMIEDAHDWTLGTPQQPAVDRDGRALYGPLGKRLGWTPAKAETSDRTELRSAVLGFLAVTVHDPDVRTEARRRGLAYLDHGKGIRRDAVDPNLVGLVLRVAGEDADQALWDRARAMLLATQDPELRRNLLAFLGSNQKPEIAAAVRELAFDPAIPPGEMLTALAQQHSHEGTRSTAWAWVKANFDRLLPRLADGHRQARLLGFGPGPCSADALADFEQFFAPRIEKIENGRRGYAQHVESEQLCIARRNAQEASAGAMFGTKRGK